MVFSINNAEMNLYPLGKKEIGSYFTPYTKINFICVVDVNIKSKIINLLEDMTNFHYTRVGIDFF